MYRYGEWHHWFAWHPVIINFSQVWLKVVYRRKMYVRADMHFITIGCEYTDLFGVLKDEKKYD